MTDIFISYSRQDSDRVRPLAEALADSAWSVFWDRAIPVGSTWAETIGSKLEAAECVLVIWSESSIGSQWTLAEARKGLERNTLVPVCIDAVDPPLPFGEIQHANLIGWDGDRSDPEYKRVVQAVSDRLEQARVGRSTGSSAIQTAAQNGAGPAPQVSSDESAGRDGLRPTEGGNALGRPRKPSGLIVALGLLVAVVMVVGAYYLIPQEGEVEPPTPGDGSDHTRRESTCAPQPLEELEDLPFFIDCLKNGAKGPQMVVMHASGDSGIRTTYAIGRYEITAEQFRNFICDSEPEATNCKPSAPDPNLPATRVSWNEAQAYVEWLGDLTGASYRLPTIVEWEYAARAGEDTTFWWGNYLHRDKANCKNCESDWSGKGVAPVGQFDPNGFGLFDTTGNVWEWMQDCRVDGPDGQSCSQRYVKGGSWKTSLGSSRADGGTIATSRRPEVKLDDHGFRVVRE